jgi:hypothetical protein
MSQAESDSNQLSRGEYESASHNFFNAGVRKLMEAQGGVYSLVSRESIEQLPDYSLQAPGDETQRGRLIEAVSSVETDYDSVLRGDLDSVIVSMDSVAMEMASQISSATFSHIAEICERTGNLMRGELTHDAIIDMMERTDFSFDDAGNPNASFVTSPATMQKIQALGQPTAEQQARVDAITARKRKEWNARRGNRTLPSRRVGA